MNLPADKPSWCDGERYAVTLAAYEYLATLPDPAHAKGCLEVLKRLHYTQSTATDLRFETNMQAFILEARATWRTREPVIEAMFRSIEVTLTVFGTHGALHNHLNEFKLISGVRRVAWGDTSKKSAPTAGILFSQYCYLELLEGWLSEKLVSAK